MLDELRRDGMALLLTTHQLDEAQQVCERIVIIDHGRVIAGGTLSELIVATVGPKRTVVLTVDQPPRSPDAKLPYDAAAGLVRVAVDDVAAELPGVLSRLHADGCKVLDVRVETPNLHMVFLHLTGRELRE
jgi:ABC-type multidrug transport system ATPase subunit